MGQVGGRRTSAFTRKLSSSRRAARTMGDASFADLSQIPQFNSAWSQVQNQLNAEKASPLDIAAAQNDLASAFNNLTSSAAGFGLSASDALSAAQQYTIAGRTILGAVNHVQGLVGAMQGADPSKAFSLFTGTMVGAAVAAGALSAGIGSIIVAGVGVAIDLLKNAGFFGSPPKGKEICQGLYINPPPVLQVGCVGTSAGPIAVSSANWRRYPKKAGGNTADASWYTSSYANWAGSPSGAMAIWSGFPNSRLLDSAFPDAYFLGCAGALPSALSAFHSAFVAAWIANKEYELNGLQSQPDWQVLLHLVRLWNRSHQSSSTYVLSGASKPNVYAPPLKAPFTGALFQNVPCPSGLPPYEATLVGDVLNNVASNDPVLSGGKLRIHTGALIASAPATPAVKLIHLTLKPPPPPASSTPPKTAAVIASAPPASTVAAVAGVSLFGAAALYVVKQGLPAWLPDIVKSALSTK